MRKEKEFWKIFLPQVTQGCKRYSYNAESIFFKERLMNKINPVRTMEKEILGIRIIGVISIAIDRKSVV